MLDGLEADRGVEGAARSRCAPAMSWKSPGTSAAPEMRLAIIYGGCATIDADDVVAGVSEHGA
ncbi:hypothetical protein EN845_34015, partial [Mesorhizobium sp. M8A.F.Ca.ET.202.01.1.1]|uniref:hypothetical protein n=1 Tax=Mesorhizobium sp. M8A.F.Ca.ET.202.01.1.1 TaxID=2563967 RepID=UPI001093785B